MSLARRSLFLVVVCLVVVLLVTGVAAAAKPTRVIIITMDQMKPSYVDEFNMQNIERLQEHGANFTNAIVGQMASETVVSHNTMVSGLFAKNMGWSDEVLRLVRPLTKDDGTGQFYQPGDIVTVGDLSFNQYKQLIEDLGYPKLGDYMHKAFPGKIVANFGEKKYQVNSTAASSSDYWVFMGGSKTNTDASVLPWLGKYRVADGNVPTCISSDTRFWFSSGNSTAMGNDYYGTDVVMPAALYSEDGRHVPGPYGNADFETPFSEPTVFNSHMSGDVWVADAAIKVMQDPSMDDWSAMHLNFSGIDKVGHMWGGGSVDTVPYDPWNLYTMVHMPYVAQLADRQIGKIIEALDGLGELDDTLIVVNADHGSTYAQQPEYVNLPGGGNLSWYYDPNNKCVNTTYGRAGKNNESKLAPLNVDDNLAYSYQSTAIEAWLINTGWDAKLKEAEAMRAMPGVIATYVKNGNAYKLISTGSMSSSERRWWQGRGQDLVNKMAFAGSADVVGLLADRTSYGVYGDHGGAQEEVQRIPMVMYSTSMRHVVNTDTFRLVDVMPTVLHAMGIPLTSKVDGKAFNLPIR